MDDSLIPFKRNVIKALGMPERISRRIDAFLDPRIGKLFHHLPKPLYTPSYYKKVKKNSACLPISIVTPSYLSNSYLEETIQSILDQKYPNLEYIIQDGGSDDGTVDIIKRYEKHLHYWDSCPDNGQSHAINRGFSHSSGEIMAYLNSDDILLPGALHYISDYFIKNQDVDVIYSHRVLIDSNSDEIGRWVMPQHCHHTITWHDFIPQETLFWRREIWNKAGGHMDESKRFAMDWELIMRFREIGAKFVRLPRFLGAFRVHDEMKSIKNLDNIGIEEMNILRKKYRSPELSDKQLEKYIRNYLRKHLLLEKLFKIKLLRY